MNHFFDGKIAKEYGIKESVFITMFYMFSKSEGISCCMTYKELNEIFVYWSPTTIRTVTSNLIIKRLLKNIKLHPSKFENTKYFSLSQKGWDLISQSSVVK
jgi:hypothetical protein